MKTQMQCIRSKFIAGVITAFVFTLMTSLTLTAQQIALDNTYETLSEADDLNPKLTKKLKEIHKVTKRFQDINVALKEGYIPDPMNICEDGPKMGFPAHVGAMGVHYFRPDLLQISETKPRVNGTGTYTDFRNPAVLIYEPQSDGSMELVAIENLVFVKPWHEKHGNKLPEFMGYEYFHMVDNPQTKIDEAHMFEPHYDLHVWLFRENPNGLFTPFNPNVTCKHHQPEMQKEMKMDTGNSNHNMKKTNN